MGVCSFWQSQRLKTAYRAPFIYSVNSEDAYTVAETMDTQLFDFGGHDVRVVLDSDREPSRSISVIVSTAGSCLRTCATF